MIDPKSTSVARLTMQRLGEDGEVLASSLGTGFFWQVADLTYLITNWHNFTGINPDTNKMMDCFIPNAVELSYFFEPTNKPGAVTSGKATLDLYRGDVPLWFEHPTGRQIDCVALPVLIEPAMNFRSRPMNSHDWQPDLEPAVGMDCFILGFPKGISGTAITPIWKRGSIATEPRLDHDRKPLVLIDTATRKGMSGSPVFVRHDGYFAPDGDTDKAIIGTVENFLGIYSGRVDDDELGVQIGRVWKWKVIDEIIDAKKIGQHPNDVL